MIHTAGIFFALLIGWSATWLLVTWSYLRAAYYTWLGAGGTLRSSLKQVVKFGFWYFDQLGADVICLFKNTDAKSLGYNEQYDRGHVLRLCIGLAGLNSGIMGAMTALVDRSGYPMWLQAVILAALALSTVAGLGHLYVAWHSKMRRWRLYVLLMLVWMVLGPVIYRMVAGW